MNAKTFSKYALRGAAIFTLVAVCTAIAQETPPAPPERDGMRRPAARGANGSGGERNREIFEQVLVARLSSELKLSDEQTVLMVRRYFDFKEESRKLRRERGDTLRQLRELVKTTPEDTTAIEAKLGELIADDEKLATAKRGLYDRLSEGLDAATRAKLYVFLQEFEGELRRLAEEVRMHRGGPNGPPPPGDMRRGERGERGPRRMEEGRPPGGRRDPNAPDGPPPSITPTDQLPAPPPS